MLKLKKSVKGKQGSLSTSPVVVQPQPPSQPQELPSATPPSPQPSVDTLSAAQQTVELLSRVEPDDVLQLMLPRLLKEREQRLDQLDQELAQIDRRMGDLQHRRQDALQPGGIKTGGQPE